MNEIEEPYGFLYITTNIINGKRYIGQRRFKDDWRNYLGSGKLLKRAIKKYGRENFYRDIVAIGYSKQEINELEIEWINNYNAVEDNDFYNLSTGGESGTSGVEPWNKGMTNVYSKETLEKISESRKGKTAGKNNFFYNKHFNDENHHFYGKHHSEEVKNKISKSKKGKMMGFEHPNSRKIICITTGKLFNCTREAGEYYNIKGVSNITSCCKGKRNYCGKLEDGTPLRWTYYDEYIKQNQLLIHNENLGQAI
jgi:group I intron endonuclease